MSNVFISHSSRDKPFVKKLATALLSEGFPIWLDSWKLELGDSLLDKIYGGIDSSSLVLLVVSKHANESGWVNREINAALSKEQATGRKFLIPLRVDDCELPLKIADRLYGDFSTSFSAPLSGVIDILEKLSGRSVCPPPERELLVVNFSREVHLNTAALTKAVKNIQSRQGAVVVSPTQVVVNNDPQYDNLLDRLHKRIDGVDSDDYFSPNLERALRQTLDEVLEGERNLSRGIALLANNGCSYEAMYWFARIVRAKLVNTLWSAQSPKSTDLLEYGKTWDSASLLSNFAAAKFFETSAVEPIALWSGSQYPASHFSIWIGKDEIKKIRSDEGVYEGPDSLVEVCRYSDIDKFVYPQLVLQHLERGTSPIPWKLDDVYVGIR